MIKTILTPLVALTGSAALSQVPVTTPTPAQAPRPTMVSHTISAKQAIKPLAVDQETPAINAAIAIENSGLSREASEATQLWNAVWANPRGITPDAFVAKLGNQAARFFNIIDAKISHVQTQAAILGVSPSDYLTDTVQSKPRTVTAKDDGTVTLGPSK